MSNKTQNSIQHALTTVSPVVTVVAVTKTFPYDCVKQAVDAGFVHFGENRIEEAQQKIELARQDGLKHITWHMIGHVQSRKVKDVVRLFDRIDSVDSVELLQKLDVEAEKQQKLLRVLIEVNIGNEKTKYGFRNIDASVFRDINLNRVRVDGIMTMAPFVTNAEDNRLIFRSMNRLSQTIRMQNPHIGPAISMGTSCDYRVAIEEGATEVRLGEALFGKRIVITNHEE